MADSQVLAPGVKAAPLDYVIPGAQEILVKAITADFDGTGAGGSFVPAIQIIAPGNKLAGTFIANGTVAAGASASVSWAPFLAGAGPNGIQYDTPNDGNWFMLSTEDGNPFNGDGILLTSNGGKAMELVSTGAFAINASGGLLIIEQDDATHRLKLLSSGGTTIEEQSGNSLELVASGSGEIHLDTFGGGTQIFSSEDGFIFDSTHTATGLVAFSVRLHAGDILAVEDSDNANAILLSAGPDGVVVNLKANKSLTVNNHLGAAILRVDENGPAYHIKTGKVWVADL